METLGRELGDPDRRQAGPGTFPGMPVVEHVSLDRNEQTGLEACEDIENQVPPICLDDLSQSRLVEQRFQLVCLTLVANLAGKLDSFHDPLGNKRIPRPPWTQDHGDKLLPNLTYMSLCVFLSRGRCGSKRISCGRVRASQFFFIMPP